MGSFSKQVTLFVVAALLFLLICTMPGQAARPEPGFSDQKLQVADHSAIAVAAGAGTEMGQDHGQEEGNSGCEVGEGAEECLMRRTLVAHTDYIYTQGKHN